MPLDLSVQGVQRNIPQEAACQELVEDAEKRVCALRQAREAVLVRLGRQFGDGAGVAGRAEVALQRQVKLNMGMIGGGGVGSGVRAVGEGMVGMQKGMLVPLMIFR
jgi:hypothetical protein